MGSSTHAQQGPSIEELRVIETLVESGDWRALYTYIQTNPNLTAGSGALAVELRSFVDEVERGRLNRFDAPEDRSGRVSDTQQNIFDAPIY